MTNIPTELLRTFVAVVDLRSFTKAAQTLGVTQPAVSAQIKRLQLLLGGELLDKSAPGVTLTDKGVAVINYSRRLLAINDQIVDLTVAGTKADRVRIGVPSDYFEAVILDLLAEFRGKHPDVQVQIRNDYSGALLQGLERGELDIIIALSETPPAAGAHRVWPETLVWAAASPQMLDPTGPVQLVTLGDSSMVRHLATSALEQAGRPYEIVYAGRSFAGVTAAVKTGLGVMCWTKPGVVSSGLLLCDSSAALPKLPPISAATYLREGVSSRNLVQLAEGIADAVKAPGQPRAPGQSEVA